MSESTSVRRSRRAFLKAVGTAAAATPLYRALEEHAVGAAPPQRFVGIYLPHGIAAPLYERRPTDTDTVFDLAFPGSVLAAFDDAATYGQSFKNKVTLIDGVDLATGVESGTNGHDASCIILTGSAPRRAQSQNESLDHFLAVTHQLGSTTPITSLPLAVGYHGSETGRNLSYGPTGVPMSPIINPVDTYALLFGGAGSGNPQAAGQASLSYLRADIARLKSRVPASERAKLEQHLDALSDIEKQVTSVRALAEGCTRPPAPATASFPKVDAYDGGVPFLEMVLDAQIDLLAQALACDLTRFATLFVFYACGPRSMASASAEWIHINVAHTYSPAKPDTVEALAAYNRFYFGKVARLLRQLDQFGVLDSTLVYASSDMGNPAQHSLRRVPTLLAGGANGRIRTGQRLSVPDGTPNNRILVSIAQAFGVDVDHYGIGQTPDDTTGALSSLLI
jgi:hypothetical protein